MTTTMIEISRGERRRSDFLFALCFLAYTFSYFGRYNYSTCLSAMAGDGLLDTAFGGIISSAYLVSYGAGQFINGRLGVRISPKYMIAVGLLGSGCANILMGSMSDKYIFLAVWAANGYFNSMLWSPIIRVFTDWITESRRARAGADISLTIPIGMTLSYLISSMMLKIADWRSVFAVCGGLLLLGGSIWIFGVSRLKPYIEMMNAKKSEVICKTLDTSTKKPTLSLKIFFTGGIVFIAIIALFNGSLKDAVLSWAPTYLKDTYAFSDSSASLVSSLLPLFSVAGPYVAIYIDKKFTKNEVTTSGILFCAAAVSLGCVMLLRGTLPIAAVILLAFSMCCMWGVNTMLLTFVPYRFGNLGISSAVTGTLNCTAYISASSCTVLYGAMADSGVWNLTVSVWAAFGLGGAAACFILAKAWKKRRPEE